MQLNIDYTKAALVSTKPLTKKQAIKQFLSKFKETFDMKDDAIDLRKMAENYAHGIIPLQDIHQAILTVIGENHACSDYDFDPSEGVTIEYGTGTAKNPRFTYVNWDQLFLWTLFQRDVAPNHIQKILTDFDPTCVIVPCAIKFTIEGKEYYCLWDGHHTAQVCRLKGYSKFPVWFIDVDAISADDIEAAGFDPKSERIQYGIWLAGSNMIRINSKNKRKLANYDQFMIELETRDSTAIAMNNILVKNNCVPKRHATCPGAFTQIKSGKECFALGKEGAYWDRALAFSRKHWPLAPLELEIFRPLSYLYAKADTQGVVLDQSFDDDLGHLLITKYGDPEAAQLAIKESYMIALTNQQGAGYPLNTHTEQVMNGLINLYNKEIGRVALPPADYVWKV
jgi:hypothetical protein